MKTVSRIRNRWLVVVLVSAMQLLVALGLLTWGLGAFEDKALNMLREQALGQCLESGQKLASALELEFAGVPDPSQESLAHWMDARIGTSLTMLGLIDAQSFQLALLHEHGRRQDLQPGQADLASLACKALYTDEFIPMRETFRNPLVRSVQGLCRLNDSDHLISAHVTLGGRHVLVVGEPADVVARQCSAWMSVARKVVFVTTLLVGFLAIFLNTSILQKFDNEISDIHRQLSDTLLKRTRELSDTQNGVIFGLAKLAESRDNDTGDHLERIRGYVTVLAEELRKELPEIDHEFIENISFASSLHDIGKVGIPDAVLLKPGKLTDLERKIMEFHTVIGGECLQAIQRRLGRDEFLKMAHDIAVAHHERWDGNGYPHKLAGDQIPLPARILAVADVYDALTSKRPYKAPMSHERSCQLIREGAGTQFDPRIVAAFSRRTEDFRKLMEQGRQVDDDSVVPAIARLQQVLGDCPSPLLNLESIA